LNGTLTVPVSRWEELEDGRGGRSVPDGTITADLVLEVDEDALLKLLGRRAIRNGTKRAALAGGAIVCRAVNVRRSPA